jgi:3',5'-cyclic AMP phosphodiesterase CpdA
VTGYTLAHFSDPHLGPLPATSWRELANKRLSGFFSWSRNRVHIHKPAVLKLLVDDLLAQAPDHTAITGDLINISLPSEFAAAAAWLKTVGSPEKVTIIPGNHDAYVDVGWAESLAHWAGYMTGARGSERAETPAANRDDFPFIRRLGPIALVGTSTAVPMPPFIAAGRLGQNQLARLRNQLKQLASEGVFRVVLIHHPPFGGGAYKRKSLLDAAEFQEVLAEPGPNWCSTATPMCRGWAAYPRRRDQFLSSVYPPRQPLRPGTRTHRAITSIGSRAWPMAGISRSTSAVSMPQRALSRPKVVWH